MRPINNSDGGLTRGILIGAVVAAVVMLSFPVVAEVGGNLILGKANTADAVTSLSGSATASLRITNTRTDAPALDLRVTAGAPPLKVNSTARVANLNADRLDGKHASAFLLAGGTAADANLLDGLDSTDFALAGHSHDASYVSIVGGAASGNFPVFDNDGELLSSSYGPSSFLGATATAVNSDKVDNRHANELVRAAGNRMGDLPDMNGAVLSTSITAPSSGYLVITASMAVLLLTSADIVSCSLAVDGGTIAGTEMSASVGEVQGTMANTCTTNLTYGVNAGAHTVDLVVSGWYYAALGNGSISVLFVPFGATGS
jgi:hypothetical protein